MAHGSRVVLAAKAVSPQVGMGAIRFILGGMTTTMKEIEVSGMDVRVVCSTKRIAFTTEPELFKGNDE
jgi:hypothetical protein